VSVLSKPYFHDEAKAFEYLESILWADGVVCPHCGTIGGRVYELKGKSTRVGLKKCGECRQQFTVKVGTVFEHGRMPLNKMLQAVYLMTCSKKGISAHQLHRTLEITYKSAWFLAHRIREAMRSGELAPFGGEGGVVEVDETFIGRREGVEKPRGGNRHMIPVLSLVHRESGQCRSFVVDDVKADTLVPIVMRNVERETYIMTDEAAQYRGQFRPVFLGHGRVNHAAGEYEGGARVPQSS
jgi:transposase-like protein